MNDRDALTEAARLLRSYAEPLIELGRWAPTGGGGVDMRTGERDSYTVGPHGLHPLPADVPPRGIMATLGWGRMRGTPRAGHIAGLDPAVAVALAELFDSYAIGIWPQTGEQTPRGRVGSTIVAVARTYLRDPP